MTAQHNRPTIAFIVAMTDDRVIGRGNQLPWHLPADLAHFRRLTLGKPIVMGRRTFESIGRPLPERHNIVLTRDPGFQPQGCTVTHDLDAALAAAGAAEELMVIGGADIFRLFLPLADRLYLTQVHAEIPGDVFFPALDEDEWIERDRDEHGVGPRNEYPLTYLTYERIPPD
jgi:dihydrofolate reductase